MKIFTASFSSPAPSFMLARGAPPRPTRFAKAWIISVMGRTIPSAASASMPDSSIFATYILSTMLYKNVMSCAITAGMVSLKTSGRIFPLPSFSVVFLFGVFSVFSFSICSNSNIADNISQAFARPCSVRICHFVILFFNHISLFAFFRLFVWGKPIITPYIA